MRLVSTIFIIALELAMIASLPESHYSEQTESEKTPYTSRVNYTELIPVEGELTYPKWVDDWVAPLEIRKWFPYYVSGYDEDGSPIYIIEYGNWKFSEALAKGKGGPAELKQIFWKYFQQGLYRMLRDGKANDTQGVGVIFDWEGFSLTKFANPIAIELALRQFAALNTIYKWLNYAILINTNFAAESFLSIAKPFIGNILEKCETFG